jgi:tripartite-type tricarboxylate transporter receptor subunit TctC
MRAISFTTAVLAADLGIGLATGAPAIAGGPWPQRTVNLIVPFGGGSGVDIAARIYGEQLAVRWKQPVVVENRTGADGLIGVTGFAAIRDDHTVLFSPAAPISVFPYTHEKITYDPSRDLVPISSATSSFGVIATPASLNVRSMAELVDLARGSPGNLNWVNGGGAFFILFAGFLKSNSLDFTHVPYRQLNLGVQDLAQGRVQAFVGTLTALLPLAQAGKVRLLAVTNTTRAPIAPDVPTVAEAGYPELEFEGLTGFFGGRDLPAPLRDRISEDVRGVAAHPGVADRLAATGQIVHASTPGEFSHAIEEQSSRISSITRFIGKPEQ